MKSNIVKAALLVSSALAVGALAMPAMAAGLNPGQYVIGGFRNICLVADGTWYGTDYHFSGHWVNAPGANVRGMIDGNYQYVGAYWGYMNDTITVRGGVADWYDYSDDNAYNITYAGTSFARVKTRCDAPAAMVNLHRAAAQ
jgi:hypothetical protein